MTQTYLVAHDGRDGVETDVQSAGELIDVLPSNFMLVRGSHVDIRALPYVEYTEAVQVDQFR